MERARFDDLSASYDELLKDPMRDRFAGAESSFFHRRKAILIRSFLRSKRINTREGRYLDVGCGKGELLNFLREDFAGVAGCDVSADMMRDIRGIETRVQQQPVKIPFGDAEFDFVTAVCVYHHVPPANRAALTAEVFRVLRPGGVFCIIEHNPLNPVTRLIVSRTPVDADAILLKASETRLLARQSGMQRIGQQFFLYFPEAVFRFAGNLESLLTWVPFGGQYAVFSRKS